MLKPAPSPPHPPQTPVLSTNPLTTQCLLVSIQQLRRKNIKKRRLSPLQWKQTEEHIFLSDFLVLLQYFETLTKMLKSRDYTLNTMCNIICSPAFPGYFPAILAAVRSNMFAPVSVQTQCTSIFFPTPRGPAIRTDLTSGDFSCTAWDPARQITGKVRNVKIQPISLWPIIFASDQELVCYTAVFSVVTQRSSPLRALRDDPKNGCVAD